MQRKKRIKRIGILETNSSSSHSLCISTNGSLCKPGDPCWDIELSEDGKKVYLPKYRVYFNQQHFQTNHCCAKVQYAFSAALHRDPLKQLDITRLLKQLTGAEEVVIGWVETYKEEIAKVGHDLESAEIDVPEIDHDSIDDSYEEIFESEETLKNFLFNPNSWLIIEPCTDHDNLLNGKVIIDARDWNLSGTGYYDDDDKAVLSIDLDGEFGRVDIELLGITDIPERLIVNNEIIQGLILDENGEPTYSNDHGLLSRYSDSEVHPVVIEKESELYLALFGRITDENVKSSAARYNVDSVETEESIQEKLGDTKRKLYKISIVSEKYGKIL